VATLVERQIGNLVAFGANLKFSAN